MYHLSSLCTVAIPFLPVPGELNIILLTKVMSVMLGMVMVLFSFSTFGLCHRAHSTVILSPLVNNILESKAGGGGAPVPMKTAYHSFKVASFKRGLVFSHQSKSSFHSCVSSCGIVRLPFPWKWTHFL